MVKRPLLAAVIALLGERLAKWRDLTLKASKDTQALRSMHPPSKLASLSHTVSTAAKYLTSHFSMLSSVTCSGVCAICGPKPFSDSAQTQPISLHTASTSPEISCVNSGCDLQPSCIVQNESSFALSSIKPCVRPPICLAALSSLLYRKIDSLCWDGGIPVMWHASHSCLFSSHFPRMPSNVHCVQCGWNPQGSCAGCKNMDLSHFFRCKKHFCSQNKI